MSRLLSVAFAIVLSGCYQAVPGKDPQSLLLRADMPTIGLLADSQLQTEKVHSNTSLLNNKLVDDLLVNVAVRTTAQNELAETGLKALLNELTLSKTDIIFYLGDGLNNGCEDEANRFFNILSDHQTETPVFMVIGNHDYLAAGNSRRLNDRESLCGANNKPLSKAEVAERIERLNQESFNLHKDKALQGWSFITSKQSKDMSCSRSIEQDKEETCFYAGVLKSPSVIFLLLDTSHYEGVGAYGQLSGAKGYVGSTQIEWIQEFLTDTEVPRVLLSHYSATAFEGYKSIAIDAINLPTNINRIGELFNSKLEHGNLWIWGHSHSATGRLVLRKITGLTAPLSIETYEVGSTTDFGNAGALISSVDKHTTADTQPLCQLFSASACSNLPDNLQSDHIPEPLPGSTLEDSVGITKAYQKGNWSLAIDQTVRTNIRYLTEKHYKSYDFGTHEEMKLCLLRLASAKEDNETYRFEGLTGAECVQETRN